MSVAAGVLDSGADVQRHATHTGGTEPGGQDHSEPRACGFEGQRRHPGNSRPCGRGGGPARGGSLNYLLKCMDVHVCMVCTCVRYGEVTCCFELC